MIKTTDEIEKIKKSVEIWKLVRTALYDFVNVGIKLIDIDSLACSIIKKHNAVSAFYGYAGFPGNVCISVNDTIIHGVPNEYVLKNGDSLTIDVGVNYEGYFSDSAYTIIVGEKPLEAQRISDVCYESLMRSIKTIKPNVTTNYDLACVIQDYVEHNGYEVIRNYTGHGCGKSLHEDPIISNYRSNFFKKVTLVPGMIICIEPMIMTGSNKCYVDSTNNWSVIAKNKKLTSHWEHMVLITETGYEILTL